MPKKIKNTSDDTVAKSWREGELIKTFKLNRIVSYQTPLFATMQKEKKRFKSNEF